MAKQFIFRNRTFTVLSSDAMGGYTLKTDDGGTVSFNVNDIIEGGERDIVVGIGCILAAVLSSVDPTDPVAFTNFINSNPIKC